MPKSKFADYGLNTITIVESIPKDEQRTVEDVDGEKTEKSDEEDSE